MDFGGILYLAATSIGPIDITHFPHEQIEIKDSSWGKFAALTSAAVALGTVYLAFETRRLAKLTACVTTQEAVREQRAARPIIIAEISPMNDENNDMGKMYLYPVMLTNRGSTALFVSVYNTSA